MPLASDLLLLRRGLATLLLAGGWVLAPVAAIAEVRSDDLALAELARQVAGASVDRAARMQPVAEETRADRARARLRLEERYEAATRDLALRRRELAAGFVALGSLAHRDGRTRLLLAGLAQSARSASAMVNRLAMERAGLARELRAATAVKAIWVARHTAAMQARAAAGERWHRALRAYAATAAELRPSLRPCEGSRLRRVVALNPVTLALAVSIAGGWLERRLDHKRAIPVDEHLDRRLLRVAPALMTARRRARTMDEGAALIEPVLPIAGRLLPNPSGALTVATTVDQLVSSPVSGLVVFAEPFRGLGPLLIIDQGAGYHVVLIGLTRLDVRRGASVVAGQSVGEIVAREDSPVRLQFELRYRGLPIDPAPWLAAYQDKVRS